LQGDPGYEPGDAGAAERLKQATGGAPDTCTGSCSAARGCCDLADRARHDKPRVAQGDSGSEPEDEGDAERLEQEMGDVGASGDVVDERLWADGDRPEPGQAPGEEKLERDAPVQVRWGGAPGLFWVGVSVQLNGSPVANGGACLDGWCARGSCADA